MSKLEKFAACQCQAAKQCRKQDDQMQEGPKGKGCSKRGTYIRLFVLKSRLGLIAGDTDWLQQVASKAVSVPGKALAGVIGQLEATLPPDQYSDLAEMHKLVVDDLRSQSSEQNPRLQLLLPKVKAIAGLSQMADTGSQPAVFS